MESEMHFVWEKNDLGLDQACSILYIIIWLLIIVQPINFHNFLLRKNKINLVWFKIIGKDAVDFVSSHD